MTQTELAQAVQAYLAKGGQVTLLRPSLAPICVPVPRETRRETRLDAQALAALAISRFPQR